MGPRPKLHSRPANARRVEAEIKESALNRQPLSRPPLARMQRIHDLLSTGVPVNRSILAGELEVTRKTIQRDLESMRDQLGATITYNPRAHSYVYRDPAAGVPPLQFNRQATAPGCQAAFRPPLMDAESTGHLTVICERHGLRAEDVLRTILGNTLADAICDSTIMRTVVQSARMLATSGEGAA